MQERMSVRKRRSTSDVVFINNFLYLMCTHFSITPLLSLTILLCALPCCSVTRTQLFENFVQNVLSIHVRIRSVIVHFLRNFCMKLTSWIALDSFRVAEIMHISSYTHIKLTKLHILYKQREKFTALSSPSDRCRSNPLYTAVSQRKVSDILKSQIEK